jgi:hypothetical protein
MCWYRPGRLCGTTIGTGRLTPMRRANDSYIHDKCPIMIGSYHTMSMFRNYSHTFLCCTLGLVVVSFARSESDFGEIIFMCLLFIAE